VTFPIPVKDLDGRQVLAIAIPKSRPSLAVFVAGVATWTGRELHVTPERAGLRLVLDGSPATLRGFNPAVLPKLIVPPHRSAVVALAVNAIACVVAFVDQPPPGSLQIEEAFFGLAANENTGEVFLMQGDDRIHNLVEGKLRAPPT